MQFKSVAGKNNLILILSLTPFILTLIFSIYKSSDTEYLSTAINISGSERMRTMLIANYAQQLHNSHNKDPDKTGDIRDLLHSELQTYEQFYLGLIYGDEALDMKPNPYTSIADTLNDIHPLVDQYTQSANNLLDKPSDDTSLAYVIDHALVIKDAFHQITDAYQAENDAFIETNRLLEIITLIFATTVTCLGLLLSRVIKRHEYHANHDMLTHIKNRHYFYTNIHSKPAIHHSILFMDTDKFKEINDVYGHEVGDEILAMIAKGLESIFDNQSLFRYGGDEFVAVIWHPKTDSPKVCRERLQVKIDEIKCLFDNPFIDSTGHSHNLKISIGAISKNAGISQWKQLIEWADLLMYRCKKQNKKAIICHSIEEIQAHIST